MTFHSSTPLAELVAGCTRNNRLAQQRLYAAFAPTLLAVCRRYARDLPEAEDMLQEAFVKIFQHIGGYQFAGSLEGWMRRITVRTAIDWLRRHKAHLHDAPIETMPEGDLGAAEMVDTLELEYLYDIIAKLPSGYRMVFNLYAIEGYSHAEIAELLHISPATARSQYTRARAALIQRIREDHMETPLNPQPLSYAQPRL